MANPAARMHETIRRHFHANRNERQLVISNVAQFILRFEAVQTIPSSALFEYPERIRYHWSAGTFPAVFAVQRIFFRPGRGWVVAPEDELGPDFDLAVVAEDHQSPSVGFRIAKVTALRAAHLDWRPTPWSEAEKREFTDGEAALVKEWTRMLP